MDGSEACAGEPQPRRQAIIHATFTTTRVACDRFGWRSRAEAMTSQSIFFDQMPRSAPSVASPDLLCLIELIPERGVFGAQTTVERLRVGERVAGRLERWFPAPQQRRRSLRSYTRTHPVAG